MGKSNYTYEVCFQIAKKCRSRNELKKKHSRAYYVSLKNGWIYDFTWFITKSELISKAQSGKPSKYTYEGCYQLAKGCESRKELQKKNSRAYQVSRVNHWLDKYTWLKTTSEIRTKWTKEVCFDLAKNCVGRADFKNKYDRAYQASHKNGWIEEMFPLSIDVYGNCDNVYRYYFKDFNAIYVGRTIRPKRRDRDHIFHVDKDTVAKFAHEHNVSVPPMEILVSNIALREGQRFEKFYVDLYREQGYTILNRAKAGSLGAIKLKR